MRRFGLVLLSSALTLTTPAAQGHSTLVTSTPKSGAVVKTFPKTFSLIFNEEILKLLGKEPSRVQLTAPNSKRIPLGKVAIAKEVLTFAMSKAEVKAGKYRLTYRVVSNDGHVISGEISFTYKP
jgi:methionine-rich copper-binding protein CopC